MRKNILLTFVLCLIFSLQSFANDEWNDFSDIDKAWDGQESVTNKEFDEVLEALEEKKNIKEAKQKKKLFKKISGGGTSLDPALNPESEIQEFQILNKKNDGQLLNVPVSLIIDDVPLEKGFYKIIAKKDENGDIYFYFYQSQFFKGKVRACITNNDYGEDEIDFVKLEPYNNKFIKILFGSLDYNAYAYVRFLQ